MRVRGKAHQLHCLERQARHFYEPHDIYCIKAHIHTCVHFMRKKIHFGGDRKAKPINWGLLCSAGATLCEPLIIFCIKTLVHICIFWKKNCQHDTFPPTVVAQCIYLARYIYLFFRRVIFVSPAMFAALRHTHTYVYLEGGKITVILSSQLLQRDTSILYRHVTSVSRNDCICCLKRRYTHTDVCFEDFLFQMILSSHQ